MKFLADMGVDVRVVEWLRSLGHDAKHLAEDRLQRASDEVVFAKAVAEDRILITFDLDFGEILAHAQERRPSVILFRIQKARAAKVISRLTVVLGDSASALERGAVVVVEESRHRIRELPVGKS